MGVGGGRRVVYGTDDGVYLSDLRELGREPVKVLSLLEVSQVDVLEDYQLLIVLSGELYFLIFIIAHSIEKTYVHRATSNNVPPRCS